MMVHDTPETFARLETLDRLEIYARSGNIGAAICARALGRDLDREALRRAQSGWARLQHCVVGCVAAKRLPWRLP